MGGRSPTTSVPSRIYGSLGPHRWGLLGIDVLSQQCSVSPAPPPPHTHRRTGDTPKEILLQGQSDERKLKPQVPEIKRKLPQAGKDNGLCVGVQLVTRGQGWNCRAYSGRASILKIWLWPRRPQVHLENGAGLSWGLDASQHVFNTPPRPPREVMPLSLSHLFSLLASDPSSEPIRHQLSLSGTPAHSRPLHRIFTLTVIFHLFPSVTENPVPS